MKIEVGYIKPNGDIYGDYNESERYFFKNEETFINSNYTLNVCYAPEISFLSNRGYKDKINVNDNVEVFSYHNLVVICENYIKENIDDLRDDFDLIDTDSYVRFENVLIRFLFDNLNGSHPKDVMDDLDIDKLLKIYEK